MDSVATPPTVRAEWAFKIFDSDGDQLLNENDIRCCHQNALKWFDGSMAGAWWMR